MTIPAHTIHSSYANNTGTGTAVGNNLSSVVCPSVVDGMLLFTWSTNPPLTPTFGTAGAQSFTSIKSDGAGSFWMDIWFLPQPEVGTFDVTISYDGASSIGAAFLMLVEGTHPSDYAVLPAVGGLTVFGSNAQINVSRSTFSGDYVYTCLVYPNRDSVSHGIFATGGFVEYNAAVNSGGGAASMGFVITQQAGGFGDLQGYSSGTLSQYTMQGVCLKNNGYNQGSSIVIRHAP